MVKNPLLQNMLGYRDLICTWMHKGFPIPIKEKEPYFWSSIIKRLSMIQVPQVPLLILSDPVCKWE